MLIDVAGVHIRYAQPDDRDFIVGLVPELLAFDSPPPWRDPQQMAAVDMRVIGEALEGRSQRAVAARRAQRRVQWSPTAVARPLKR